MEFLPQFPLRMVAFPGEKVNLHIFEPRYKQLFNECQLGNPHFGIVTVVGEQLMPIGTKMQLLEIKKVDDNGELDVTTIGVGRYQILEFSEQAPNKLYGAAEVIDFEDGSQLSIDYATTILELWENLREVFEALGVTKPLPAPENLISWDLSHSVGLSLEQEYEMLCLTTEKERIEKLFERVELLIPRVRELKEIKRRAMMNGEFRRLER